MLKANELNPEKRQEIDDIIKMLRECKGFFRAYQYQGPISGSAINKFLQVISEGDTGKIALKKLTVGLAEIGDKQYAEYYRAATKLFKLDTGDAKDRDDKFEEALNNLAQVLLRQPDLCTLLSKTLPELSKLNSQWINFRNNQARLELQANVEKVLGVAVPISPEEFSFSGRINPNIPDIRAFALQLAAPTISVIDQKKFEREKVQKKTINVSVPEKVSAPDSSAASEKKQDKVFAPDSIAAHINLVKALLTLKVKTKAEYNSALRLYTKLSSLCETRGTGQLSYPDINLSELKKITTQLFQPNAAAKEFDDAISKLAEFVGKVEEAARVKLENDLSKALGEKISISIEEFHDTGLMSRIKQTAKWQLLSKDSGSVAGAKVPVLAVVRAAEDRKEPAQKVPTVVENYVNLVNAVLDLKRQPPLLKLCCAATIVLQTPQNADLKQMQELAKPLLTKIKQSSNETTDASVDDFLSNLSASKQEVANNDASVTKYSLLKSLAETAKNCDYDTCLRFYKQFSGSKQLQKLGITKSECQDALGIGTVGLIKQFSNTPLPMQILMVTSAIVLLPLTIFAVPVAFLLNKFNPRYHWKDPMVANPPELQQTQVVASHAVAEQPSAPEAGSTTVINAAIKLTTEAVQTAKQSSQVPAVPKQVTTEPQPVPKPILQDAIKLQLEPEKERNDGWKLTPWRS